MFPTISAILCLVLARRALLRNGLTFASYNSRSRRTRRRWARRWAIRWRGTTTLILATNTATFARALFILSSAATFFLDTVSFLAVTRHYSINLGVGFPKPLPKRKFPRWEDRSEGLLSTLRHLRQLSVSFASVTCMFVILVCFSAICLILVELYRAFGTKCFVVAVILYLVGNGKNEVHGPEKPTEKNIHLRRG